MRLFGVLRDVVQRHLAAVVVAHELAVAEIQRARGPAVVQVVVGEVDHDLLVASLHVALATRLQHGHEAAALDRGARIGVRRLRDRVPGEVEHGGKQVHARRAHAADRARLHAGAEHDERHAKAALAHASLAAAEWRVRLALATAATLRAVVCAVEDIGVVGNAHLLQRGHHAAHLRVHVVRAGDCAHGLAAHAGHKFLRDRERFGCGFLLAAETVVRDLHEEGLARLHLLPHERDALVGDLDGLLRVGLPAVVGALVAVGAVAHVEAHAAWFGTARVPLAEVRGAVAEVMQHAAARLHAGGKVGLDRGRDHSHQAVLRLIVRAAALAAFLALAATLAATFALRCAALVLVGHVQLRRADASHEACARGGAAGAARVEVAEAHAPVGHLLQVRRQARGARGAGWLSVHVDRGAAGALRLGLDEHEVRWALRGRGLRVGRGEAKRSCERRQENDRADACLHADALLREGSSDQPRQRLRPAATRGCPE